MANLRAFATSAKWLKLDAETAIGSILQFTLTASYVLLAYTTVVGIVVLPFADPREIFMPPQWLWPVTEIYFLLDAFLSIVFGPGIGIALIATLVVVITTPRVTRWLRVGINELLDGQHDDAYALIVQINPFMAQMNQPQSILPTIAATIAQTLKLPYVELEAQAEDAPLRAVFGTQPPDVDLVCLPLLYHDTQIGELRVAARHKDRTLSHSGLTVLRDMARQVGIALYAAQLTGDLQRARIRLVTAREEERRRIRRDLHDGLGPTLANFAMQLEQACERLPAGAEASAEILATLTRQAQNTIADVRRLVYDLRPPDLDEFGLLAALREYMHPRQTNYTVLRLDEPTVLPALPAAVEVATYRIVQEAVNNALKHAHASEITVSLTLAPFAELLYIAQETTRQPHALYVEIVDNGTGIPADHTVGIGLHSIRERAEELGGNCTITSDEQGTRVVAYLPLESF